VRGPELGGVCAYPPAPPSGARSGRPPKSRQQTHLNDTVRSARSDALARRAERYGRGNSVYRRFCRWAQISVFEALLENFAGALRKSASRDRLCHCSRYAHAAGAKRGKWIRRSGALRGGLSTKVHVVRCQRAPTRLCANRGRGTRPHSGGSWRPLSREELGRASHRPLEAVSASGDALRQNRLLVPGHPTTCCRAHMAQICPKAPRAATWQRETSGQQSNTNSKAMAEARHALC
jgi:hypothetical protein